MTEQRAGAVPKNGSSVIVRLSTGQRERGVVNTPKGASRSHAYVRVDLLNPSRQWWFHVSEIEAEEDRFMSERAVLADEARALFLAAERTGLWYSEDWNARYDALMGGKQ